MSDTPKVDAFLKEMLTEHEQKNYNDFDHYFFGMRDLSGFARDLERQMNRRASDDLLAALKRLHDSDPNASQCTEDELVDAANHDGDPVVREQAAAFLQARAAIARHS